MFLTTEDALKAQDRHKAYSAQYLQSSYECLEEVITKLYRKVPPVKRSSVRSKRSDRAGNSFVATMDATLQEARTIWKEHYALISQLTDISMDLEFDPCFIEDTQTELTRVPCSEVAQIGLRALIADFDERNYAIDLAWREVAAALGVVNYEDEQWRFAFPAASVGHLSNLQQRNDAERRIRKLCAEQRKVIEEIFLLVETQQI